MSILSNTEVVDRTASIAKVKSLPTLIGSLGVFGATQLVGSDSIQFDVQQDGSLYVLEDHLMGVQEKNSTTDTKYDIHTLPLMHQSVSKALTRQMLSGVRAFGQEGEEQLSRAIATELEKQSNHLDLTKEYLMASALIKNQVSSNVHGVVDFSSEFSISRPTEDLTDANLLGGLRSAMKKARSGVNGRGLVQGYTALVSEQMWEFLVTSNALSETYQNGQAFPNGNPLLLNIPELNGHSVFRWGNIDFILYDQTFQDRAGNVDQVLADDTGVMFPKVTGGSLGSFFAGPSSRIDFQSAPLAERYAYSQMGAKRQHVDVEAESNWLPLITAPGAVVDLSFTAA
ncbi:major capsid protein [Halomonas litopenaei]|uniref:major capsid protein n=1 Tax=Halomonas litopenaei TaxID=2109328 RepID=UPI003FA0A063